MTVIDASAALEWILGTTSGRLIASRIPPFEMLHAPHLLDVEVTQGLRGCLRAGLLTLVEAGAILQNFLRIRIRRYPHKPLLTHVWQLRNNLSAYDALYVALAQSLNATLITHDRRLAAAPGHRARIQLL